MRQLMFFVALLVVAGGALAQPMADRLPGGTACYVGWRYDPALADTAAGRMLADERLTRPWRELMPAAVPLLPDGLASPALLSPALDLLDDAIQSEGCFALFEREPGQLLANPQGVVLLNLGERRKAFEDRFQPITDRLKRRLGERMQMTQIGGSWLWVKSDTKEKTEFVWGFVGDWFIAYWGDGAEQMLPFMLDGKLEASLGDAPRFRNALEKIPGDGIVTTYIDGPVALNLAQQALVDPEYAPLNDLREMWRPLLGEIGADNIEAIVEKVILSDDRFISTLLVQTDGPPRGLLPLAVQESVDDATLRCIPVDAMVAATMRLDLAKSYARIRESAIKVFGEDARRDLGEFERAAEAVGLPVADVLDPLGDQWAIYNAPSTGGFIYTGWTLIGSIDEPDRFNRTLEAVRRLIARQAGAPALQSYEVDGVTIEYFDIGGFLPIFSPAWAKAGDRFIVALYPQLVEGAIARIAGESSLLDNPHFAAARERTGSGTMFYVSMPRTVRNVYPIGLVIASVMGSEQMHGSLRAPAHALLPSLPRLETYLSDDLLVARATADGIVRTYTTRNPLLSPMILDSPAVWMALGAGVIPMQGSRDHRPARISDASNLRQIGQGILLYSIENRGKYPPDLGEVARTQDIGVDAFISPLGEKSVPRNVREMELAARAAWVRENSDYVYLGAGKTNKIAPDAVVAHRKIEEGDESVNVLFGDGHVEWLSSEQLQQAIERDQARDAAK